MREVIKDILDYKINIYRRSFDKMGLILNMVSLIISVLILISLTICGIFIPNSLATIILNICSVFSVLFLPLFIAGTIEEWRECDIVGTIDDYTLSFKILEKKELVLYTFYINEVKEIKLLDKKSIVIYIKNGQIFLIEDICNAKKVIEMYKMIKNH